MYEDVIIYMIVKLNWYAMRLNEFSYANLLPDIR